jgi:hypothetical protein
MVKSGVHTEEGKDLDDSEQGSSESCLIQKLWDEEEHKGSAVDEGDGAKDHFDGEQLGTQLKTVRYKVYAKQRARSKKR